MLKCKNETNSPHNFATTIKKEVCNKVYNNEEA